MWGTEQGQIWSQCKSLTFIESNMDNSRSYVDLGRSQRISEVEEDNRGPSLLVIHPAPN